MTHHESPRKRIRRYNSNPNLRKVQSAIHQRHAALAVARKVGHQFPPTAEGALFRGIFRQAVSDLFVPTHRPGACRHLQGWIFEAEICGVDSDWIRLQLKRAGVSLEESLE